MSIYEITGLKMCCRRLFNNEIFAKRCSSQGSSARRNLEAPQRREYWRGDDRSLLPCKGGINVEESRVAVEVEPHNYVFDVVHDVIERVEVTSGIDAVPDSRSLP